MSERGRLRGRATGPAPHRPPGKLGRQLTEKLALPAASPGPRSHKGGKACLAPFFARTAREAYGVSVAGDRVVVSGVGGIEIYDVSACSNTEELPAPRRPRRRLSP